MLTAKFPLYGLRQYTRRFEEPPYILVETRFNRYILDIPMLAGNYAERRLGMLGMELDYVVYPLKERYTTLAQILRSSRKEFIDMDGKVWKLSKHKFYKLKSYAILSVSTAWNGKYLLHTRAGNFVSYEQGKYVTVVETGKGSILFDVGMEPTTRKRVKM